MGPHLAGSYPHFRRLMDYCPLGHCNAHPTPSNTHRHQSYCLVPCRCHHHLHISMAHQHSGLLWEMLIFRSSTTLGTLSPPFNIKSMSRGPCFSNSPRCQQWRLYNHLACNIAALLPLLSRIQDNITTNISIEYRIRCIFCPSLSLSIRHTSLLQNSPQVLPNTTKQTVFSAPGRLDTSPAHVSQDPLDSDTHTPLVSFNSFHECSKPLLAQR